MTSFTYIIRKKGEDPLHNDKNKFILLHLKTYRVLESREQDQFLNRYFLKNQLKTKL